MLSVFEFKDYRNFLKRRFAEMPKRGHGQLRKLSHFLNVHPTLTSQVFKGRKDFTLEQAASCCDFLGMSDAEGDYFLLLVQLARAGSESLRGRLRRRIQELKRNQDDLSKRVHVEAVITEEQRAVFYSHWVYSAFRQMTAIPSFDNIESIANHFGFPLKKTKEIFDFLLKTGLCVERGGKIKVGPSSTHLDSGSPWLRVHHLNWRQRAMENLGNVSGNLNYTAPMTLSVADGEKIREMIIKLIEKINESVDSSPSEKLYGLNIDWFPVEK